MEKKKIIIPSGYFEIKNNEWILSKSFKELIKHPENVNKLKQAFGQTETKYIIKFPNPIYDINNNDEINEFFEDENENKIVWQFRISEIIELLNLISGPVVFWSPDERCHLKVVGYNSDEKDKINDETYNISTIGFKNFEVVEFVNFPNTYWLDNVNIHETIGNKGFFINNIKKLIVKDSDAHLVSIKNTNNKKLFIEGIHNNKILCFNDTEEITIDITPNNNTYKLAELANIITRRNKVFAKSAKWEDLTEEEKEILIFGTKNWLWPSEKSHKWEIWTSDFDVRINLIDKNSMNGFKNLFETNFSVTFSCNNQNSNNTTAGVYLLNAFYNTIKNFSALRSEINSISYYPDWRTITPYDVIRYVYDNLKIYSPFKWQKS